jgi:hypothetical protein
MHFIRRGQGAPPLLVHGLSGIWRFRNAIVAAKREAILTATRAAGSPAPAC